MKKMDLLGLSVVTAALIMTGCSSDSDETTSGGATAPIEVTTPSDMNVTDVQNAMALLTNGGGGVPTAKAMAAASLTERQVLIKANALSIKAVAPGETTYPCAVSGTWTETFSSEYIGDDGFGGWSDTWTIGASYDNCVDNASTTVDGVIMNRKTSNGSWLSVQSDGYDGENNTSFMLDTWNDNYQDIYDSNITEGDMTSRTSIYNNSGEWGNLADGDMYTSVEDPQFSDHYYENGIYSTTDTNSSGHVIGGWEDAYGNLKINNSSAQDGSHGMDTADGFYAAYSIDENGKQLVSSNYFNNFSEAWTENGNENTIIINGTIGNTCLGGSATFATDLTIQENTVDYWSDANASGPDVLPYAGILSITGTTTATVTLDVYDINRTRAKVVAADANKTFFNWSEFAVGACAPALP